MPPAHRSATSAPGPQLLPGALLLRRDARTLQVGTSPGIVIADRPGLGRLLRLLDGALTIPMLARVAAHDIPEFTDDLMDTLTRLVAAGAVLPAAHAPAQPRVAVRHDRSTSRFAQLLISGVGTSALEPDIEIMVSAGEPARSTFETLVSARVAHLPVVLHERRVRIGPFVAPGATPCLGCLDSLLSTWDPAWSGLIPQFERSRLLPVALPDSVLLRSAAEVARQFESLRAGDRPATIGRILTIGPGADDIDTRVVPFAPQCPCGLLAP